MRSQVSIFRKLQLLAPEHVFDEACYTDVPADSKARRELLTRWITRADHINPLNLVDDPQVLAEFPRGIRIADFNERQMNILARYGASEVYAFLAPRTTFHVAAEIPALCDEREAYAGSQIMKLFGKSPGAEAVLIYGSGHDFPRAAFGTRYLRELPLVLSYDLAGGGTLANNKRRPG